jgi:isoquinoline 1-oxidoreductase alpha subunit
MPGERDLCYARVVAMPREQSIKNNTGGIEHIRTLRFVFLPPCRDLPVRDNGRGCSCDHAQTTVPTEIGTSNIGKAYEERGTIMIKIKINGQEQSWDGDPDLPLLWFLRDEAGLTGTKYGCGQALCGACTVIVDKEAVRSCITSINDVAGREVTTIEGLHPDGDHPVQKAWRQVNVPQCGFCQAGQIMQAAALLMDNPKPSHDQIREAMSGNICRCGCYQRIENAVHLASTGV